MHTLMLTHTHTHIYIHMYTHMHIHKIQIQKMSTILFSYLGGDIFALALPLFIDALYILSLSICS